MNKKLETFILITFILCTAFQVTPINVNGGITITVPDDHATIQWAIGNATAGDTIYVRSDTYHENLHIDKQLTLEGEGSTSTIITADGSGNVVNIDEDDVVLTGFTLRDGNDGIYLYGDDRVSINDCIITNCTSEGIYAYYTHNTTISNCLVNDISSYGISCQSSRGFRVENCTTYNIDSHGIRIDESENCWVINCTGYNTSNGIYGADSPRIWVINCNQSNANNGIYLNDAPNSQIIESICYSNEYCGIRISTCDISNIVDCELYDNSEYGIEVQYSDNFVVKGCSLQNNTDDGIRLWTTDLAWIKDCIINDSYYGIEIQKGGLISICNSTSFNNTNGLRLSDAFRIYSTDSTYYFNNYGIYMQNSKLVMTNSNLTDNNQDGIQATNSEVTMKYCSIENNQVYGADEFRTYLYDARDCWWGNETGPYHDSLNPTGTGDEVDSNIEFDPWLTEPYQPEVLLSDLRCQLRLMEWLAVYPDRVTPKPQNRSAASVSDWLASSYMTTKIANYAEGLDTEGLAVNQTSGEPMAETGMGILCFGGPAVSSPVYYYEVNKIAPVIYNGVPGAQGGGEPWSQWYLANGSAITEAAMGTDEHNDLFLMESFVDDDGRVVVIAYGIDWRGTYAAGKFFDKMLFTNLATFNQGWVIVKWEDTNMNGFVDNPEEGDTYTVLAEGN
jgi:parallel beta-helix repeat protein